MKIFIISLLVLLSFNVNSKTKTIDINGRIKKQKVKAKPLIRVHVSAFEECNQWCQNQCDYIVIDLNQDNLHRYVCKK